MNGDPQPALNLWARELHQAGVRAALPAVIGLAVLLLPWLTDGPALAQPDGVQGVLRALGVLTGVAGAVLWVVSLLLMLRFPAFDRLFGGLERQYFAHHLTGTWAYLMLLAHPLLLVAAVWFASPAAAAALAAPWGQPFSVVAGWLALVGLMAMMFATFFSGLPYATWKRIHAASGIAYLFALAHVVALAPASGAGGDAAWVLIAAMAAGLVVIAVRALLDRGALGARHFCVDQIERVSPTTVEVTLEPLPGQAPLEYAPGQFVFVAFDQGPGYAGCREYHPFTVSSPPGKTQFKVMVKALGDCTGRMQAMRPGVAARVQGPYGGLFRDADYSRPQLWLAGGIGVTPFLPMAQALPAHAASVDLFYLARDENEAFGLDELRAVAARKHSFRVHALLSDTNAETLHQAVVAACTPLVQREVYVCGPPGMLQATLAWLAVAGVPAAQIHAERFDFR